tara:strand:- start:1316 stop:1951 length:636 start_codon:yes stop_codon:yes gene_type:complete
MYVIGGKVGAGDCKRIIPLLPSVGHFTVILESPGGSLTEGMCFSENFKRLAVTTVVRETPILSPSGGVLYKAGHYTKSSDVLAEAGEDRVVICASACSLMFLGGEVRRLQGEVFLGIHSPRSTRPYRSQSHAEAGGIAVAAKLLKFLQHVLLVEDGDLRRLFITIPSRDMYYLQARHFPKYPWLKGLATHYYNFQGYTSHNRHNSPNYHRR